MNLAVVFQAMYWDSIASFQLLYTTITLRQFYLVTHTMYNTVHPTAPTPPMYLSVTRALENEIELNWLPPTEPNGEVHYVIYYTPEGGSEQNSSTGSNLTHYNLTGLERNMVYTNIAVQAVNSAGRSDRSAVIAQYNHTPPIGECSCTSVWCIFNALLLKTHLQL